MSSFTSYPCVEVSLHPSSVYTGWLPSSTAIESSNAFFDDLEKRRSKLHVGIAEDPTIKALEDFLTGVAKVEDSKIAQYFFDKACHENKGLVEHFQNKQFKDKHYIIPQITDAYQFTNSLAALLNHPPKFYNGNLVGLPFAAVCAGVDATLSGSRCFSLPGFNDAMRNVLNKWSEYLDSSTSGDDCFGTNGDAWLSQEAKDKYHFDQWKQDDKMVPYWKSWNSFFTRQFKDPTRQRPIAAPGTNQIVCSPNDGQLFRWDMDIKKKDTFWLKDMNYSLQEIFSSSDPAQQQLMDDYKLADTFRGGYIFQTFLNPFNFHRWWAPVNGKVLFDPIVIQGVYYNKLVMPDFNGATTASLPYLVHVNTRGIVVFEIEKNVRVCCIPIGMIDVSTVQFDAEIKAGAKVIKGQEIGMFKYGGSSFAILFQKVPGKDLIFHSGEPYGYYPPRPSVPTNTSDMDGIIINVGQQIGEWVDATGSTHLFTKPR